MMRRSYTVKHQGVEDRIMLHRQNYINGEFITPHGSELLTCSTHRPKRLLLAEVRLGG